MIYVFTLLIFIIVFNLVSKMENRIKLLWFRLFGKNHNKNNEHEIQFGDLVVTGKDKFEVELPCIPKRVRVEFTDNPNMVPCNPHHDRVSWDIKKHHGKHLFIINWHVSGIREIKWTLFY